MNQPEPQNPQPSPVRETFHQEMFRRAQQFAQDMLTLVPELEAVAIVPSWEVPQDRLPFGVIAGRNGSLRQPAEVMHMAEQLHGTLRQVMDNSYGILHAVNRTMQSMAEEINDKQRQLDELNAALSEHENRGETAGRDPGEAPGEG